MNLVRKGKDFLDKNPKMINVASCAYNLIFLNQIRGKKYNKILTNGAFLHRCKVVVKGSGNRIIIGEKTYLKNTTISISGNNNTVLLGNEVAIFNTMICFEDDGGALEIGDGTAVFGPSHMAIIEGKRIIVGDECLFSSDIVIRTGDSHSLIDKDGERINASDDVIIGQHTWIGHRAIVLKGSRLENNTVVATGAVVTKQFKESNVVVGGVPARVIKTNINWDKKRIRI